MNTFSSRAWAHIRPILPDRSVIATMTRQPRRDLLAGVTVAIVALPLALGFGISSGLGAAAGLATTVVAGTIAALLGGSNLQVSGPTGAMTVVLVPIVGAHGANGVLTVGLMAGLILIVLAVTRAGRYIAYIPAPVIEGFTLGIAAIIALQQLPAALGVPTPEGDRVVLVTAEAITDFASSPHWPTVIVTSGVVGAMLLGARWRPTVPFSLLAVVVATVVVELLDLDVARIGDLPSGLSAPSLDFIHLDALGSLLMPAVAVAALAALESLLSATVADGMSVNQRHDPDKELFGQGVANLAAPMFGGIPNSGVIARTAVNVRSGAASRLAALVHALVLGLVAFAAASVVERIPLAALAGVLLATAIRMVEVGSVRAMLHSTRADAVVLVLTAVATLALDLVQAVILGLVVAGAFALQAVAGSSRLAEVPLHEGAPEDHSAEEWALLAEHVVAYRLDGPLFFAGAHRFLLELSEVSDVRVVILRMSRVTTIDATGALVLKDAIDRLERRHITVLISGIRGDHERPLDQLGVITRLRDQDRVFAMTSEAIRHARAHIGVTAAPDLDTAATDGD